MTQKLVSIGIPTYNSSKRLAGVLENFLSQTYQHIEIIVSDDASRDDTFAVCTATAAKDARVRCIRQEKNLGQLDNFPFVLKEAKGEYFMWASDDDRWSRDVVKKLVGVLDTHPGYDIAMGSHERSFEDKPSCTILLEGRNQTTGRSYLSLFVKMCFGAPLHSFFYGIYRCTFIMRLMERMRPNCIHWDRVLMAEAALATHFYSISDVVFFKQQNPIPVRKRYKDALSDAYMLPFSYSRYLYAMLARPISSSLIPWRRKVFVPFIWCALIVYQWRKILGDIIRAYRYFLS